MCECDYIRLSRDNDQQRAHVNIVIIAFGTEKTRDFLDQPSEYHVLKDSAAWISLSFLNAVN